MAVIKAAVWGGVSFATLTSAVLLAGNYFLGTGYSRGFISNLLLGASYALAIPLAILWNALGLSSAPSGSFVQTQPFVVLVYGLFGGLLLAIFAAFWHFLVKGDSEKSESKLPGNQMNDRR
jgi:hypothetical protein